MTRLPNYLVETRKEIYADAWKKYKAKGIRLVDLAKIFKVEPSHLFYVLKEKKEK